LPTFCCFDQNKVCLHFLKHWFLKKYRLDSIKLNVITIRLYYFNQFILSNLLVGIKREKRKCTFFRSAEVNFMQRNTNIWMITLNVNCPSDWSSRKVVALRFIKKAYLFRVCLDLDQRMKFFSRFWQLVNQTSFFGLSLKPNHHTKIQLAQIIDMLWYIKDLEELKLFKFANDH